MSASGYLNDTFLNSTNPFLLGSNFFVVSLSLILGSISNISVILLADTDALGSIIEIIEIIKKLITICIAYWINANISPTCITPLSMLSPPTHIIKIDTPFIISINNGIIIDIVLFTNIFAFVKSVFAPSNLFSSLSSVLNALITDFPVNISLATPFNLSIKSCSFLNFGIATANNIATTNNIVITAAPIIQAIDVLL